VRGNEQLLLGPDDDEPEQAPSAVDRESHRRIRNRAKRAAAEGKEWWIRAFSSTIGRRELYQILDSAGLFRERFAVSPTGFPDHLATFAYAGEQRLASRLYLSWLKLCPEGVNKMLAENHSALAEPVRRPRQKEE
jgi:hypothetical protein